MTRWKSPARRCGGTWEICSPDHLTKERIVFYRRRRQVEGHMVGPADARRKKPTSDGTLIRELVTLRAALKWARAAKWIADLPHIAVPAAPPPRDRWLTREEADRLIENACCTSARSSPSACSRQDVPARCWG
jgi:hypothetical protein